MIEQKQIPRDLPARLVNPSNFHITLIFLGAVKEERISEICDVAREIAAKHNVFSINLDRIDYGPINIIPPRMVWAIGARGKELSDINKELQERLARGTGIRDFSPHITLARIKEWQWRQIEPEERPIIGKGIDLSFDVKSIDVMESKLKRTGAEYKILKSFLLK